MRNQPQMVTNWLSGFDNWEAECWDSEPEKCRRLWVCILIQQIKDALGINTTGYHTSPQDVASARSWLRRAGSDMREVCSNAGIDPDMLRDAWVAGKITRETFVPLDEYRRKAEARREAAGKEW